MNDEILELEASYHSTTGIVTITQDGEITI